MRFSDFETAARDSFDLNASNQPSGNRAEFDCYAWISNPLNSLIEMSSSESADQLFYGFSFKATLYSSIVFFSIKIIYIRAMYGIFVQERGQVLKTSLLSAPFSPG
jgi:hypothetical protein